MMWNSELGLPYVENHLLTILCICDFNLSFQIDCLSVLSGAGSQGLGFWFENDRWDCEDFPREFRKSNLKAILGSSARYSHVTCACIIGWNRIHPLPTQCVNVCVLVGREAVRERRKRWGDWACNAWVNETKGRPEMWDCVCSFHVTARVHVCNTVSALLTDCVSLSTFGRNVWTAI